MATLSPSGFLSLYLSGRGCSVAGRQRASNNTKALITNTGVSGGVSCSGPVVLVSIILVTDYAFADNCQLSALIEASIPL